jgi:beta-1,3-N-acetylgalactosaminyltransferase 2
MRVSAISEAVVPVGPVGYDFQVNFPVTIKALGVYDYGNDGLQSNITVTLYDTTTKQEITHVIFSPDNPGMLANGVRFTRCPVSIVLTKEFRASIIAEGFTKEDPSALYSNTSVDNDTGGGLISYLNISRTSPVSGLFPEFDYSLAKEPIRFVAAAFIFEAHVKSDIESQTESSVSAKDEYEWLKELEKEENLLQEEAAKHGDILFIDVVDVYRNIPAKLKSTYKWISQHMDFRYLLKTDDDCFVNIEQILKDIESYQLDSHRKVWWGNFRTQWGVEKFGKWAEVDYTAPVYPAFACGSGYVVSADLIHWISNNSDSLKLYQGEDVCMGIWLSAVCPSLLKDPRWECFSTCYLDTLTLPEQDADSLLQLWTNLHRCGNPCWC